MGQWLFFPDPDATWIDGSIISATHTDAGNNGIYTITAPTNSGSVIRRDNYFATTKFMQNTGASFQNVATDDTTWCVATVDNNNKARFFTADYSNPTSWTDNGNEYTLGTETETLRTIATDGTDWFAAGIDTGATYARSLIWQATDPTGTWTVNTNVTTSGPQEIKCIANNGAGLFLFAGDSGAGSNSMCYTDDSGATWSYDNTITGTITAIAYHSGVWTAADETSGRFWTNSSADLSASWVQNTSFTSGDLITDIYYDDSTWVAVDSRSTVGGIITASDPTSTWTKRFTSPTARALFSTSYDGTRWTAVGFDFTSSIPIIYNATTATGTWTENTTSDTATVRIPQTIRYRSLPR